MITKVKLWIAKHYILTLLIVFLLTTTSMIALEVILETHFPLVSVDTLYISFQFLSALLGGLCSSIVVIYASKLQNEAQLTFLKKQESNERERLLLTFYMDKIKEFEQKHKVFIHLSNDFIQNEPTMDERMVKTSFNQIRDTLILLYRFQFVFQHMDLTDEWQQLSTSIEHLHEFFVVEAHHIDQQKRNPQLNVAFKEQHYFAITILISNISNKLLEYQTNQILHLVP